MGLQKVFKEIEQKSKHLPEVVLPNGSKVDHAKNMKKLYRDKGMSFVNGYIKEVFYEHQMKKIREKQKQESQ